VAEERRNEARENLLLVEEGPRREQVEQARARVRQAKEALELARTRLSYATIASPLSGIVLSKNVEPGDYVSAGTPVVTIGDLSDVWMRAYIEETDLGRVKTGQPVDVTTDSYPGKTYAGRISFIAPQAEFTPKSVQTRKERVKLVYRIKVAIANPSMELKPGMPADGVIRLR
jgi:HlyD family secretion protein